MLLKFVYDWLVLNELILEASLTYKILLYILTLIINHSL